MAVFCLIGIPPLQDAWAYYRWERIPAHFNPEKKGFSYMYKGTKYYSPRVDFWERVNTVANATNTIGGEIYPDLCYVAPGNPTKSVYRLDAHKRFDRAGQSLFLAGIVICVGIALSIVSRYRKRQSSP